MRTMQELRPIMKQQIEHLAKLLEEVMVKNIQSAIDYALKKKKKCKPLSIPEVARDLERLARYDIVIHAQVCGLQRTAR